MKRTLILLLAIVFVFSGCGKKGEILPPLARVPQAPQILSLVQQGGRVVLEWLNPEAYQDGRPLPGLARVEVWGAELKSAEQAQPTGFSPEEFEDRAVLKAVIRPAEFAKLRSGDGQQPGMLRFSLPLGPDVYQGRVLTYALRAFDIRQRKSPFSEIRSLDPKPLPRPPFNVRAEVEAERVVLCWEPVAENIDGSALSGLAGYRVFRAEKGAPFKLITEKPVKDTCFHDSQFIFGQAYIYAVRAAAADSAPYDESSDSLPLEVTPRDTFPPQTPSGLTALPGEDYISLAWNLCPDTDLAGYRVWRREEGGGEFKELAGRTLVETTYLDRTPEKGKRYEYAVTAEDVSGNRSPLSAPVIESLR